MSKAPSISIFLCLLDRTTLFVLSKRLSYLDTMNKIDHSLNSYLIKRTLFLKRTKSQKSDYRKRLTNYKIVRSESFACGRSNRCSLASEGIWAWAGIVMVSS